MMNNENDDEQRKLEEKYKIKKTSIIEEENEFSDSDSSLDGNIDNKKPEEVEDKEPEVKLDDKIISEPEAPLEDDKEEQIVTTKQSESPKADLSPRSPKLNKLNESSFSIISKAELDKNFDHLSNFDPDDEFLRSEESFSVIGSVVAKDVDSLSEYSDFSIVSDSRVSQIRSSKVIQTERDIYIEDVAMQKIIHYISFFSDDVKRYLNKIRSKEGLLQMDKQEINLDFFELELDNIDTELIKLILDVLEHFDMFRLCLIVCNRYGMQEHVSRYLTSICYKYSNLKYLNGLKILKINENKFREDQKHVNVLANEAIHSMLKLINPNMIKQVRTEIMDENSKLLNVECWRYIYYLGFWKKLVYIMDTHSSLQLCYSVKDFENFKTVYLINYREELLDDEIRDLIENPCKPWIDETTTGFLKYLCNRLDIELSAQHTFSLDRLVDLNKECTCNLNVNKFLAYKNANQIAEGKFYIFEALKEAYERFSAHCKLQEKVDIKNTTLDYKKLLDLFDIFYFYGRIFKEKYIREGIKMIISDPEYEHIAISYIFKILDFLVNFIDDTSIYSAMFNQDEVDVIVQALFIPQGVRSFSKSKLTLSTLTTMLMSRHSPFYKNLETYATEFRADKYNREFIKLNEIEKLRAYDQKNVINEFVQFKKNDAGRNHDYLNIMVADLEAEYLHVPITLCFAWMKKIFYTFMSTTICKETIKDITVYEHEEILGNQRYNDALLTQYIKNDYLHSLTLLATHLNVKYKFKCGNLFEIFDSKDEVKTSNSQLSWLTDMYADINNNVAVATRLARNYYTVRYTLVDNKHLNGITQSLYVNRKLEKDNKDVIQATLNNLELLENIHINQISCGIMGYDLMLQKVYLTLKKFDNFTEDEEHTFESNEMYRFNLLINATYILAKIGRLDIISRMLFIKEYIVAKQGDDEHHSMLINIITLVKGIEHYQMGRWYDAIQFFISFMRLNYKTLNSVQWLRIFERTWYMAITLFWGPNNGVFLPVSALNYVAEDTLVIENNDVTNTNHLQIHCYENIIDIQTKSSNPNIKTSSYEVFKNLINHFKEVYEDYSVNRIMDTQKILISSFNMMGTLAANCDQLSKIPYNLIEYFVTIYSNSEVMHNDNVEKFIEYFGDQYACMNFRQDFLNIDDEQKNDTLYYDVDEDSNNQYLVLLYLKSKSENPMESTQNAIDSYYGEKFTRMIKQKKILSLMHQPFMNYILKIKTEKGSAQLNQTLKLHEHNWISVNQTYNPHYALRIYNFKQSNAANIAELYKAQNKLINIFNNHYSIRNSLDTHFIVNKLNEINKFLQFCFDDYDIKVDKPQENVFDSDYSDEESFNPFIEIGEDHKEKQFVKYDNKQEEFESIATKFAEKLESTAKQFNIIIEDWLEQMPEPESLNINFKQAVHTKRLKWEKMLTSKEKIRQLQNIFKVLRSRKSKKR